MDYTRGLGFKDKPDYDFLKRLFKELFVREGFQLDSVFDWTVGRSSPSPSPSPSSSPSPPSSFDSRGWRVPRPPLPPSQRDRREEEVGWGMGWPPPRPQNNIDDDWEVVRSVEGIFVVVVG